MKMLCCSIMLTVGAIIAPALAVHGDSAADTPINEMCPIGKEPIVPSAGTIEYKGKTIGLCCPGCGEAFLAWEEDRRDAFVALAMRGAEPGQEHDAAESSAPAQDAAATDEAVIPYPLNTCIVADSELGSMGEPVVREYGGREVKFCCAGCIDEFEANQAKYFKKLDALIVKDQMRYYPTDTCIVAGDELADDTPNLVYRNRLVRLCCNTCARKFNEDPDRYLKQLDELVAEQQRKAYPLATCIVAGSDLGSMGEPTEIVVAGRLFRFCCAGCEGKVKDNPAKFVAEIDKAWQAKGMFLPDES